MPNHIVMTADGLQAGDNPIIPFIEGDGTGPDIWRATQSVVDAAVELIKKLGKGGMSGFVNAFLRKYASYKMAEELYKAQAAQQGAAGAQGAGPDMGAGAGPQGGANAGSGFKGASSADDVEYEVKN